MSPNPIPSSPGTGGSLPASLTAPNYVLRRAGPASRPNWKRSLCASPERTPAGDTTASSEPWPISATPFPIRPWETSFADTGSSRHPSGCAYRKSHLWPEAVGAQRCKSDVRTHASPQNNREAREVHIDLANKGALVPVGDHESALLSWGYKVRSRLPSSCCAALVAVVKVANLHYGNYGAAFQRVDGPRFRRSLANDRCVLDS